MAKPRKAEKHMITGKPILKVGGSNFKAPAMTAPWAPRTSTSLAHMIERMLFLDYPLGFGKSA
jgi:hypothetical protein